MRRRGGPPPLGQHFLYDPVVVAGIIEALDPSGHTVLEIGPGEGVLTRPLAEVSAALCAVEVDAGLFDRLRRDPDLEGVTIRQGDILSRPLVEWVPAGVRPEGFLLVGNLPYMITSPVIFATFEALPYLKRSVLMMQREVAERLTAPPGSRRYGLLSVLAALHADASLLFEVGPDSFRPPPKVHSAVVRLDYATVPNNLRAEPAPDPVWLRAVVKAAFGQRRKKLRNALRAGFPHLDRDQLEDAARAAGVDLDLRAEAVPPARYVTLATAIPRPTEV